MRIKNPSKQISRCLPQVLILRMVLFCIRAISIFALPLAFKTFFRLNREIASFKIIIDGPSVMHEALQNTYQYQSVPFWFYFCFTTCMIKKINWRTGCSGFHYKEWRNVFYPALLPQRLWF